MKKAALFIGIFFGVIFLLWVVGRLTNLFQFFSATSTANEPTIPMDKNFFASRLKSPQLFDFICYQTEDELMGKYIAIHRVCGMPGDTVQLRNGDLFVNGRAVDQTLTLRHLYRMHQKDYDEKLNQSGTDIYLQGDSVVVFLDDKQVNENHLKATRKILPASEPDQRILQTFSAPWNQDHFGPVKVPADNYFVMGDNRLGSNDSRYTGFVSKDKWVATALWIH